MVAAVAAGATLASTAASVAGSASQSDAVSGAAQQAQGISQQAIDQAQGFKTSDQALANPFITQGTAATNQLATLLGLNGTDAANNALSAFQASPSFGYARDQGLRAIDAGAASRGLLHSGATIKAEQTLGDNLANQDFGAYLGRLQGLTTTGLQGLGLNNQSTSTFDTLLSGQATGQAQTATSAGAAQSSIYGNQANALSGGITNLAGQYAYGQQQNALSGLAGNAFGGPGV